MEREFNIDKVLVQLWYIITCMGYGGVKPNSFSEYYNLVKALDEAHDILIEEKHRDE